MNMKKIKKSVKKSTKNNYRIEALEPRLMMDGILSIKKSPSRV